MIELEVRRFGNSLGMVLPEEVVRHLATRQGGAVYLTELPEGG